MGMKHTDQRGYDFLGARLPFTLRSWTDVYYHIKHLFQRDKNRCPRCGHDNFEHGYIPESHVYFCQRCNLWFDPSPWRDMNGKN